MTRALLENLSMAKVHPSKDDDQTLLELALEAHFAVSMRFVSCSITPN